LFNTLAIRQQEGPSKDSVIPAAPDHAHLPDRLVSLNQLALNQRPFSHFRLSIRLSQFFRLSQFSRAPGMIPPGVAVPLLSRLQERSREAVALSVREP